MSLFAIGHRLETKAAIAAHEAAEVAVAAAANALATTASIEVLAQAMAERLDAPVTDVFHMLCDAPANIDGMMQAPEGWVAMANYVAREFGCEPWHYRPQVH